MKHELHQRHRERAMPPEKPQITRYVSSPSLYRKYIEQVDKDGIIDRYSAASAERLSDATITIDSIDDDKKFVIVQVAPANMQESSSRIMQFRLVQGINKLDGDIVLSRGERIVFKVTEGEATGIWLSFNVQISDEVVRA